MTLTEFFRNRLSLQTLIILLAVVVAPAFGVAIAAALRGQTLLLAGVGAVIGVFVLIYAPVELVILAGVLGTMLADSRLVDTSQLYYVRFIPMAMLPMRSILDIVIRRERKIRSSPALLGTGLALTAYAAFSSVYAEDPGLTLQRSLAMLLVVVGFGLGLPNYLVTHEQLSRAVKPVIVVIAVFVLAGVVLGAGQGDAGTFTQGSYQRVNGFFQNVNTQGLMAMLIFYPLVWWRQTTKSGTGRLILSLLILIWGVLVVLSGSRASFVGVVAGVVTLIWIYGRASLRFAPLVLGGLLLFGALVVVEPQFGHVLEYENTEFGDLRPVAPGTVRNVDRPFLIQRAIELGMRSPLVGIGFGGADKVYADDRPYLVSIGVYIGGSHNSYMRMFIDLGLIGVVGGLAVFGLTLGPVLLHRSDARRDVTLALMTATVAAGLTNAFFEEWLFGFGNASTYPMWFFFALIPIRLAQLRAEDAENAAGGERDAELTAGIVPHSRGGE